MPLACERRRISGCRVSTAGNTSAFAGYYAPKLREFFIRIWEQVCCGKGISNFNPTSRTVYFNGEIIVTKGECNESTMRIE